MLKNPGPTASAWQPPLAGWIVVGSVVVVWFLTLGFRHLLPSDEGRYAEIAREMFLTGDWVTIRYQGLKYFEKPPLHLWATALAYTAFGVGDWQARLWVGISGAAGLAITALAAWRWYGSRAAVLTGCALLAAPAWTLAGHINSLDMGVASALAAVLSCLLVAQHPDQTASQRRRWMWGAWLAVAIGILGKGLIGLVLPGLAVVAYSTLARDWRLWGRLHIASGLVIMIAVAAPWFVLVSLRNPEFPQFFFIHEHWQRYTSGVHHRGGPWWYFVPQLALGFAPWLGLTPRMVSLVGDEPANMPFRPALFVAVWAAVIVVFFSASGSKLPGYIIPVYPALAILAGVALDALDRRSWARQIVWMAAIASAAMLATPYVATLGGNAELEAAFHAFAPWLAAGSGLAIVGLGLAWWLNRGDTVPSIVAGSIAMFGLITVVLLGHESFGRYSSGFALAAEARRVIGPDMPLYSVERLDHTVPFYMRRTAELVAWPDELAFGTEQEPDKWLPTMQDFLRQWARPVHAAALMSLETYAMLAQQGVVMFPVAQDTRRVVVLNFARR